jgi:uncharacterized integral membrane protein
MELEADPGAPPEPAPTESPRERRQRHGRRTRIYLGAIVAVVLLGLLLAWVIANRDRVEVNWLVGSTEAALSLVIFVAAAIGWVLGMVTAGIIRRRTRRPSESP